MSSHIWFDHRKLFMIPFISLFEPIFIAVLLTRILLLYPSFFPMAKFKFLGSIYMPMSTEKSTFDNACSLILFNINRQVFVYQWFERVLKELLRIYCRCWITNFSWPCLGLRTKNYINICSQGPAYLFSALPCKTFRQCHDPSRKVIRWKPFCCLYFMTKKTIICRIKPFSIHPCFIWINTILVTDTAICTYLVGIFNLAEIIFVW